jgi:enoyl-CoA hydratase
VEKPVVMAIHGSCLGGALEMACSCDFRLAAQSASFGLPEIRLGVLPGSGGTSRLTRLVGPANAKWLVMAGQDINAERASQMGLVQAVWADEEFDQRSREFCVELAALPQEATAMAKIAIDTVADLDRTGARQVERIANTFLTRSDEHRSIMDELSKRKKKK